MKRVLVFDPFAGISGDMTLGALVDLGLSADWLRAFVASLGLAGVEVRVERAMRRGISCGRVAFDLPHEHAHRHLRHVLEIVDRTPAPESVRRRAARCFERIADAEAKVHGTTREKIHFHEVGALDAILDVLVAMAGVEELGFDAFCTRPVAMGHGWIDIEHGRFPVPAPATLEILHGIELTGFDLAGECTTPTGAAILAELTAGRPSPSAFTLEATGFGAGTRDPDDRPNCLRLIAGSISDSAETLHIVQTDIDDMTPEYMAWAQEAVFAAGAQDVTSSPVSMKKGRTGLRIEVLAPESALQSVIDALFLNTSTIGIRRWRVERPQLERTEEVVEWRGQRIRRKRVRLPGGASRAKPEYDDVIAAAKALGLTAVEARRQFDTDMAGTGEPPPIDGSGV
ncbi:MAG TPA: nickel pincer cofactor biosynthesis protein LarC [Longimicrobiales bacterium]|nr:nickel pincer cofactor biosynthesis protein LarC [Longimicrobiales bacterium]